MKITNIPKYNVGFFSTPGTDNRVMVQNSQEDCFESSRTNTNDNHSNKKSFIETVNKFIKNLIKFIKTIIAQFNYKPNVVNIYEPYKNDDTDSYHKSLSEGIKNFFDLDIPPENLKSIMTPKEFRELLPTLNTDNFIAKNKNIENGKYFIDLDYESNYSKGSRENIFDIMDNVADFADKYHAKTGKDFVFALADKDTPESAQQAIRIIGENPEKFKHVKFLPAMKISYTHEAPNSDLNFENCNFLLYGINPFSYNLSNFTKNTIQKRKQMLIDFIHEIDKLYPEFSYKIKEFIKQNDMSYDKDFCISNLYWRAREYAQKTGEETMKSTQKPIGQTDINKSKKIVSEADRILFHLGQITPLDDIIEGPDSNIDMDEELNTTIKRVFEQYSTHLDEDGELQSSAENLFNDLISCLEMEPQKPILAFAAPYYLCQDFDTPENIAEQKFPNTVEYMKRMVADSKGMLCAFQSVVPMYTIDKDLGLDTIKDFNTYIRDNLQIDSKQLYEVGGSFGQYDKSALLGS
ncbi:MAG: hypothetical protein ACI37R_06070 [Candidatus Avigastranaerophilus sp.]